MMPTITAVREADRVLVCVSGELDLASNDLLQSRCAAVRPARTELVLDLTGLTFVDCASLRVLARLARSFADHGGRPRVVVPEGPIARVVEIAAFFDGYELTLTPSSSAAASAPPWTSAR